MRPAVVGSPLAHVQPEDDTSATVRHAWVSSTAEEKLHSRRWLRREEIAKDQLSQLRTQALDFGQWSHYVCPVDGHLVTDAVAGGGADVGRMDESGHMSGQLCPDGEYGPSWWR